ncbi:ADP-ribosylglycohydrolase family protein [Micrococcus sp.]|uniref:ADP-ribosylglycohydrolase family protein n=1 Tax=Micrococcus sp. TaxID=1271 RepID=UPI002A90D0E3|nr:ADP-ribosylglycohydrolase family protein [Micrococcus sp.]MDY6055698.1 ADP-ribosylglycohydrolase family protein [Micrococcus sp.]
MSRPSSPDPDSPAALPGPVHADRVLALLAAGAAGDAMGGVVEFLPATGIVAAHGPAGITDPEELLAVEATPVLPVTDDTQMTLYVLDGLLEWIEWQNQGVQADPAACVWLACLRWWATQNGHLPEGAPPAPPRWIDDHTVLHVRRAPGNACLSGLGAPGMGLPGDPCNPDAKGSGTVMRSAPYGMVPGLEDRHVVSLARQGAVLSHGHPTAWTAAAAFALTIAELLRGADLPSAVDHALAWLGTVGEDAEQTRAALEAAVSLAGTVNGDVGAPGALPEALGEGWVAEEGLGVAVYAALTAQAAHPQAPAEALGLALRIAVNHDGGSDTTASLTGQLLGAAHGTAVFGHADPQDTAGAEVSVPGWIAERDVVLEAARRWRAATT